MNLKLINFIAKRFSHSAKRQRFLNFARMVALVSVMLGSFALIVSLSVLDGFETMLKESAVKFTSHISLRAFDNKPIQSYDSIENVLRTEFPEIELIAPVIEREGLIRSKTFVEGVLIKGTSRKYDITQIHTNIKEGIFDFTSGNSKEVIIGRRLARKLGVSLGDTLVLYAIKGESQEGLSMPEVDKFKLTGIYETGMAQYDDIYVYIPFAKASEFFKMPAGSITSFDIMLKNIDSASAVSKRIDAYLGFPFYSFTVFELHKSIFTWIEYQKAPIPLVLGLISIVAVLNIITILLIVVVEKTHSIGILRALGMERNGILSIFVVQGTLIGLTGTLLGSGLGFILCWLQQTFSIIRLNGDIYFLDTLPIRLEFWHYAVVIGMSVALSFLATLIPSAIAVKVSPVRAIRFK
jgi:lipoprotein-releasing system permease protein